MSDVLTPAYCPDCHADRFPAGFGAPDRISPAHFSARFGRDVNLTPYLDGEELVGCVECMAGEDGWAVCWAPPPTVTIGCTCPTSNLRPVLYVIHRGRVRVESWMEAGIDSSDDGTGDDRQ